MRAKRRSCLLVLGLIALLVVAVALIFIEVKVYGTGFTRKTLWDWLQLLVVPLVLAVIALVFQLANTRTEHQIAQQRYEQDQQITKQRYEQDQQIALNKQREDLLQAYIDRMSELLLKENLRSSAVDAEASTVARARTLTVLPQLDAQRKGNLIQFLSESKLQEIISLSGADLSGANLSGADLNRADLSGANLSGADLNRAKLSGANLSGAKLSDAKLHLANLNHANLNRANLFNANLSGANLNRADLRGANLPYADLRGANLSATLAGARLVQADLSGANLSYAILSRADLQGAIGVTVEELETQAESLNGATMPDGSIHP